MRARRTISLSPGERVGRRDAPAVRWMSILVLTRLCRGLVGFLDVLIGLVEGALGVVIGLQGALIFVQVAVALAGDAEDLSHSRGRRHNVLIREHRSGERR